MGKKYSSVAEFENDISDSLQHQPRSSDCWLSHPQRYHDQKIGPKLQLRRVGVVVVDAATPVDPALLIRRVKTKMKSLGWSLLHPEQKRLGLKFNTSRYTKFQRGLKQRSSRLKDCIVKLVLD